MKIAFVAPFGLGQKTTVWARTLPLAKYLVAHGHEATILIPPWDTPADSGRSWVDGGVQMINVSIQGGLPATLYRLLAQVDRLAPDIIHIVKPRAYAGLVQWWHWQQRRLQRSNRTRPVIILDVDDWEQSWAAVNGYPWPLARFLAWQEEWGIRHADGVTAASRWLVERVNAYAPATPRLYLPNGIAQPPPQAAIVRGNNQESASPQSILLFTRFTEVTPEWLAAFAFALTVQAPGVRLLMGGQALAPTHEVAYRESFAEYVSRTDHIDYANPQSSTKQYTTKPSVEWLGYIQPATLPDLYAQLDCAIFPAANVPLNQAKCSVKLATTLLHGVPVVASAVGEQAAYGANGAARLVAADATPTEFAAAVADVLRRPDEQRALSERARQHLLDRYDWVHLGEQLEGFYTQVLDKHE